MAVRFLNLIFQLERNKKKRHRTNYVVSSCSKRHLNKDLFVYITRIWLTLLFVVVPVFDLRKGIGAYRLTHLVIIDMRINFCSGKLLMSQNLL